MGPNAANTLAQVPSESVTNEDYMAESNHELIRALFALVEGERSLQRLKLLYRITDALYFNADAASMAVFLEIRLWCGLKIDTPSMAEEYVTGIVESFPWISD